MKNKAFTLVEILLVLGLFLATLGFSVLYTQFSQVRSDLNAQTATFVSYARLQQSLAASGKNDQSFGLHLTSDAYTLFEGSSYSIADPANIIIELPSTLEIQNIALNGGGSDLIFNPPEGRTTQFGTLDFYSTTLQKSITINFDAIGTLNY